MEEERRASEELRTELEKEREELRTKLKDATNEVRGQMCFCQLQYNQMKLLVVSVLASVRCELSLHSQICRLESAIQQQEKKDKAAPEAAALCGPHCSRLEEELHQTRSRLARVQEDAEKQWDRQQRDIASLRADKHRLEEKVLEQSRLNTERSLLEQSQRHTEDRIR